MTVNHHRLGIPAYASSLVRAQVVDRRRAGAQSTDPLFVRVESGTRANGSALRNILRSASYKLALAVGVHDSMASSSDALG